MSTLIYATTNKGKIKEVKQALPTYTIKSLLDYPEIPDIPENGMSFEENAYIKAKAVYDIINLPVIADDSGIIIDSLQGKYDDILPHTDNMLYPGIYSARLAAAVYNNPKFDHDTTKTNDLVLKDIDNTNRNAHYITTLCLYNENGHHFYTGTMNGTIGTEIRGTNGFAYDTIFIPDGSDIYYAQMTNEEKNKISHRVKAFNKLIDDLNRR